MAQNVSGACRGRVGGVSGACRGRVGACRGMSGACRGRVGGVSGACRAKFSDFKLFSNRKRQFCNYLPENASIFNISAPKQSKTQKKTSETDRTALECQFFPPFRLVFDQNGFSNNPWDPNPFGCTLQIQCGLCTAMRQSAKGQIA